MEARRTPPGMLEKKKAFGKRFDIKSMGVWEPSDFLVLGCASCTAAGAARSRRNSVLDLHGCGIVSANCVRVVLIWSFGVSPQACYPKKV